MNNARAVFVKQLRDIVKNKAVLLQYLVMPVMALALTQLVAKPSGGAIPVTMFVSMFTAIFVGMVMPAATTGAIAEDRERGSLRFLVMAGVKPVDYLLGVGGVILATGTVVLVAFGLMGGLTPSQFGRFIVMTLGGGVASVLLGAVVGLLAGNQQAATAVVMPISLVFGFGPMIAMFNVTTGKLLAPFYTMQMSATISNIDAPMGKSALIVLANIVVLLGLFVLDYKKRGLRA
ncbi:MAG: ABC transporter permease [Propionibacteriaceae bacterium]|nr:ABC transporter permease [Propionibacteriaceae bacterium]